MDGRRAPPTCSRAPAIRTRPGAHNRSVPARAWPGRRSSGQRLRTMTRRRINACQRSLPVNVDIRLRFASALPRRFVRGSRQRAAHDCVRIRRRLCSLSRSHADAPRPALVHRQPSTPSRTVRRSSADTSADARDGTPAQRVVTSLGNSRHRCRVFQPRSCPPPVRCRRVPPCLEKTRRFSRAYARFSGAYIADKRALAYPYVLSMMIPNGRTAVSAIAPFRAPRTLPLKRRSG